MRARVGGGTWYLYECQERNKDRGLSLSAYGVFGEDELLVLLGILRYRELDVFPGDAL